MASLAEVLQALAAGSLTARAYTENLLARIRTRDERVRAFTFVDPPRVLAIADACDAMRRGGAELGPLHGLPVGVKDIFDTCDMPTEMGSAVYAEHRPALDAMIVERMKAAGAFVLGKTTTTEFAYMHPAETRNPWNPHHTPGGSSAGSAAAVAAGFVHVAIGTQTNGSVIRPAAFCGVVGYKPTQGLLPIAGALPFSPTLDQVGTFARAVSDVARFTAPLSEGEAIPAVIAPRRQPPRLGVIADYPWARLEAEAREHFDALVVKLRAAGAASHAIELPHGFNDANLVHRSIMLHEGARNHGAIQVDNRRRLSIALNDGLDEGRRIAPATYGEMLARRAAFIERATDLFEHCEVILTPPAAGGAPRRLDTTGDPGFCTLWSLVGFPALTLPVGLTRQGVPLGAQLIARAGCDAVLLEAAEWIERAVGPIQRLE